MKFIAFIITSIIFTGVLSAENSVDNQIPVQTPSNETIIKITNDPKLGKILTDSKGMTLYTYSKDKENTSVCYDQCAITWPPYVISSDKSIALPKDLTGTFSTIKRQDNKLQVAYNGTPLYYYNKDSKPGDTTGHGVDNEWSIVNPAGTQN